MTVAFVRVRHLDHLPPADRAEVLQHVEHRVGEACEALDVCWVETDVARGRRRRSSSPVVLPQQHDDDELRARRRRPPDRRRARSAAMSRSASIAAPRSSARSATFADAPTRSPALTTITAAAVGERGHGRTCARQRRGHRTARGRTTTPVRSADWRSKVDATRSGRRRSVRSRRCVAGGPLDRDLVGRRAELGRLRARACAHGGGRGSMIEVIGPPGIGKTRLSQAFLAAAPSPRLIVAR